MRVGACVEKSAVNSVCVGITERGKKREGRDRGSGSCEKLANPSASPEFAAARDTVNRDSQSACELRRRIAKATPRRNREFRCSLKRSTNWNREMLLEIARGSVV